MASKVHYTILSNKSISANNSVIPIFYSCNDNHVNLTLVSMTSVIENTKSKIAFYILYSDLSEESMKKLHSVAKNSNCKVNFKKVDASQFKEFKNVFWVTVETWFRVLIPDLFLQFDKVIYLDCDTLLRGDIKEFYDINISNNLVGAVKDVWGIKQACQRTDLTDDSYFNAGVLLMNAKKWRENNLYQKIMKYANNNKECAYADQDVLNYIVSKDKKLLSTRYNYLEGWWGKYKNEYINEEAKDYEKSKKDALIVHFTAYKPDTAKSRHSMKEDWWKIAKKTDYYMEILEKYRKETDSWLMQLHNEGKKTY